MKTFRAIFFGIPKGGDAIDQLLKFVNMHDLKPSDYHVFYTFAKANIGATYIFSIDCLYYAEKELEMPSRE